MEDMDFGNNATVPRWARRCRDISVMLCFGLSEPIGGPGKIVEIDESMFGKSNYSLVTVIVITKYLFFVLIIYYIGKYNRGKARKGKWVFGGVERESNRCFLVPVLNRKASTLIPLIKHFILPGTTILSDCWLAYNNLPLVFIPFCFIPSNLTYRFYF